MGSIIEFDGLDESPLVLACGPRKGGNTDHAARIMAEALEAAGAKPRLVALRELDVAPCRGCQACHWAAGHACPLMGEDDAEALFRLITGAPMIFLAAPIYYYHLPAGFKGFIDRGQRYFEARMAGDAGLTSLPPRLAHACFVAGRPKGEKLFEGSLLTLKYFFWPFQITLGEHLGLRGLDRPGDLKADARAAASVTRFAGQAWAGRAG
jgi:putative NADPH-quinone reductase